MNERKLFLIDAMALIYRSFYALNKNPRVTSKGMNVSAILGFCNTLFDIFTCESDLAQHNYVENTLFVPLVKRMEADE